MGIINVLDFQVANLIAAGEVVDRPASVVKELLENAVDAGATVIVAEIQNGGISFIRVCDNGKGIAKEDVSVAIRRHATSKIKDAADLDGILTLGFRGEALAAIASVSKLRIITKQPDAEMGTLLLSEVGEVVSVAETGCQDGTTVIVEELFSNVPARRKFLKKDSTEAMAVTAIVEKIALSKPDVSIKLIIDGQMKFFTSGDGEIVNAIYAVLGKDFAKKLAPVKGITGGIEVTGYVGRPDNVRGNRNYQNFFINGRYVKSKTALAALEQAFHSFLASDKFPCCVLYIRVHPAYVDVNVHPTKLEVKFSDEHLVFDAIYSAVRSALQQRMVRPELVIAEKEPSKTEEFHSLYDALQRNPQEPLSIPIPQAPLSLKPSKLPDIAYEPIAFERPPVLEKEPIPLPTPIVISLENHDSYRLAGELFSTYLLVELDDKVLIIDKHAAHERILFEDLKRNLQLQDIPSQGLLTPLAIKVSTEEYDAIFNYQEEILHTGFAIELQNEKVILSGVPSSMEQEKALTLLETLAGQLAEEIGTVAVSKEIIYEKALYQAACKAAMKAGQQNTPESLQWLCEKLMQLPNIQYCPHGRPVAFELTKHTIEKQLKRI